MLTIGAVKVSAANVDELEENDYAKRQIWTITGEKVDFSVYLDFRTAPRGLGRFLDKVYNRKRIQSSPGNLISAEFESQWHENQSARACMHDL
jgi:hypothetical protein